MREAAFVIALLAPLAMSESRANAEPPTAWRAATESPVGVRTSDLTDREGELLAHCGTGEAGLRQVAQRVLAQKLAAVQPHAEREGRPSYLDLDALGFAQRMAGEPHVWPRAWVVSGRALDHESVVRKLDAWKQSFRDLGERRCGVAIGVAQDGTEVVAAVAIDALADLSPLPTRARAGQFLLFEAQLLVPATGARVVVLGPSGAPRTVPTSFDRGRVRARFAPDRPGAFTVQLVADVATGPRPVLEASVFAEMQPPREMPDRAAPGEEAAGSAGRGADALTRMVDAMRRAEGLALIPRDPRLDVLALAHARRMRAARTLGHDVGDGDPALRLRDADLTPRTAGENVAHSPSVVLAHRALYASPSHRANLLRPDFERMGIAVLDDPDGSVWVAEIFVKG